MAKTVDETSSETARTRFDDWRKTRSRKAAIPDELWSISISGAGQGGEATSGFA
jgi:hypothetical protein